MQTSPAEACYADWDLSGWILAQALEECGHGGPKNSPSVVISKGSKVVENIEDVVSIVN